MSSQTGRKPFKSVAAGAASFPSAGSAAQGRAAQPAAPRWARGVEGQRKADPGHIVGEDGKRYLFVNSIRKVRFKDDGLATDGPLEAAYSPWRYPEDWVVEDFAPEGPKLLRRGEWFYLVTAVGARPARRPATW